MSFSWSPSPLGMCTGGIGFLDFASAASRRGRAWTPTFDFCILLSPYVCQGKLTLATLTFFNSSRESLIAKCSAQYSLQDVVAFGAAVGAVASTGTWPLALHTTTSMAIAKATCLL